MQESPGAGLHSCILVLSTAQLVSSLMQLSKPDPIVLPLSTTLTPLPLSTNAELEGMDMNKEKFTYAFASRFRHPAQGKEHQKAN